MNTPRILLCLLLTAGTTRAQAQDNPAPATEPAQTEMQKWIATTDAQWQAVFKRDVTDVHAAELNKVKLLYLTSLDDTIKKASSAGDLDGAVALRNEQKRFGDTQVFPEQDEAGDAASVKQLRAAIRVQLARVEKESAVRAKALHTKYDQVLANAQTQLTQRQRIDDALLVKAKREEVAAAWITNAVASASQQPPEIAKTPSPPAAAATKATPQPKSPMGTSMDDFFIGKAWQSAITTYTFAKDGTCLRQAGNDSETMRWHHLGNKIVEVSGKNKPDTRYFRFVSATEAYYSGDKNDITKPVHLK